MPQAVEASTRRRRTHPTHSPVRLVRLPCSEPKATLRQTGTPWLRLHNGQRRSKSGWDSLETILARFMAHTEESFARTNEFAARTEESIARTNESVARTEESIARLERIVEHHAQEGARYREEAARERREMNKRWGELANKMGTVVEDIVAPSVRRLARDVFGCGDLVRFTTRQTVTRSDDRSRSREFDALYVGSRAVLLNSTKSSPRPQDARAFVEFLRSGEFRLYFPEYETLPIVPAFSSLSIPEDLVTYLTRHGIYALAMGDEAMQVLNLEAVRSRTAAP